MSLTSVPPSKIGGLMWLIVEECLSRNKEKLFATLAWSLVFMAPALLILYTYRHIPVQY